MGKRENIYRYIFGAMIVFIVLFVVYALVVPEKEETAFDYVEEANTRARQWLFYNFRTKGLFVYEVDPYSGEYSNSNNAIRQLMASRVLAEESAKEGAFQEQLQELHQQNLDFLMEYWYREEGEVGYIVYDEKSKLGANAMMVRTFTVSPFFEQYKEQAKKIVQGIYALQHEDGSFDPWLKEPDYAYDKDRLLTFYSGEALVALVEYYEKTGDSEALASAVRGADFYIVEYVQEIDENYYPAYVPWHTIAYNKLYKITQDKKYADAIFVMNDKLLEIQDTTDQVGRFYNPKTPQYGTPHASSDAVYTEGLAYAFEIAQLVGDSEREGRYRDALRIGVHNLLMLQYRTPLSESAFDDPLRYIGGIRISTKDPNIRVDSTQHAIDAFTKIEEVID